MVEVVYVALGGAAGAVVRFLVSRSIQILTDTHLPLGTFTVNVVGSFILGIVIGIAESIGMNTLVRSLVATGFLGALTTFSTFSLETVSLFRAGYTMEAMLNLLMSVVVGIAAIVIGFILVRTIVSVSLN